MIEQRIIDKLKGYIPESVLNQIPETAKKFNITNVLRLAHFLSQCSHESGNFKFIRENLNYSATALRRVFPKYFPGNLSVKYARQPEKIANRVYGNRMGNGDEKSGDGYKFRGRGFLQITGKDNYKKFDKFVDDNILENPDLIATKYPLMSGAFFFINNGLWTICDQGSTDEIVTKLTKRVNGGVNGLKDRLEKFSFFYKILTD